jgi:biotin carboxylase
MTEKWLICVTAGEWQYKSIIEAKNAGYKILAIDSNSQAASLGLADCSIVMAFSKPLEICKEIESYSLNLCGVISFASEAGMGLVAQIAKYFSLNGMDRVLAERFIDKSIQRKIWKEQGVESLAFEVFDDPSPALEYIINSKIDLIVKPCISSGSRGVQKIASKSHNALSTHLSNAFHHSKSNQIILEQYIQGTEFIIEVFFNNEALNILAILQKNKVPNTDNTVASELFTPDISEELFLNIAHKIRDAYIALGYKNGPGHAEIIIDEMKNIHLVEVAARGGGFLVYDTFVPKISNINLPLLSIKAACGDSINDLKIEKKYGLLSFIPTEVGILKSYSGFEEVNMIPGVEADFFGHIGRKYSLPSTDGDRIGYVMVVGAELNAAWATLEKCKKIIQVKYLYENH